MFWFEFALSFLFEADVRHKGFSQRFIAVAELTVVQVCFQLLHTDDAVVIQSIAPG